MGARPRFVHKPLVLVDLLRNVLLARTRTEEA
jgi:hypothetical protein